MFSAAIGRRSRGDLARLSIIRAAARGLDLPQEDFGDAGGDRCDGCGGRWRFRDYFERLPISPAIDRRDGEPRAEHERSCSRHHRPPRPISTLLAPASGRVYW